MCRLHYIPRMDTNVNTETALKRAVTLAIVNDFSHLGSVAGSYVWLSGWRSTYRNSCAITLSCFGLGIIMTFNFREHLRRENVRYAMEEQKARDRGECVLHKQQEDTAVPVVRGETGFRYLL